MADYKRSYDYLNGLSDVDLQKALFPCKDKVGTLVTQMQRNVKAMQEMPAKYLHPFNWIITGASQSGKTYFLSEVLRLKKIQPMPDSIHLFRGVEDSEGKLMQVLKELERNDGIEYNVYSGDELAFVTNIL
jgi:predicted AAA+ superfamily ATPase